jgi:hypothetical protein
VVVQVGPDPGKIFDDVDAERAQVRGRPDPGQHQSGEHAADHGINAWLLDTVVIAG